MRPRDSSRFLPEVEGFRAIALLGVLLFHAELDWASRGYLGVDAFFVLSGFLITRGLDDEFQKTGRIAVGKFYLRRIRRLFPTLALVVLATLLASWFVLLPHEVKATGNSARWALLSLSNIHFWLDISYFDPGVWAKPLLHTWSLSVEEQFYLVWPACFLLLHRHAGRARQAILAAGGLASLVGALWASGDLGVWGAAVELDGGSNTFFLPWYRAFEFLAGCALVDLRPARASRMAKVGSALAGSEESATASTCGVGRCSTARRARRNTPGFKSCACTSKQSWSSWLSLGENGPFPSRRRSRSIWEHLNAT